LLKSYPKTDGRPRPDLPKNKHVVWVNVSLNDKNATDIQWNIPLPIFFIVLTG
jgi:hypothetical protein